MALGAIDNYTTGSTILPDVGVLSYNGCLFGPLFQSNVSGECVADDAQRTTKLMQYTITVDGYVTLHDVQTSIAPVMDNLRSMLTAYGGALTYEGRGNDITVNVSGSADVAWGPVPKLLEFQPLGGGRSAKVKWTVKVNIYERQGAGVGGIGVVNEPPRLEVGGPVVAGPARDFQRKPDPPPAGGGKGGGGGGPGKKADNPLRMLQFNYESTVSYGEDGFSTLSCKGILEIPLTRSPNQTSRTFRVTADDLRGEVERRVMSGIDLTRFRMTRRNFTVSRDKRSLMWDFSAEEKPYMDLPAFCSVARGSYNVRPAKAGMGMVTWLCTLRCTYTVIGGNSRRAAWSAFLAMLRLRMSQSVLGGDFSNTKESQAPKRDVQRDIVVPHSAPIWEAGKKLVDWLREWNKSENKIVDDPVKKKKSNALLIDFGFEEGLYLDSKSVTFHATWRLTSKFSQILLSTGLWTKVDEKGKVLWATTIAQVSGAESWLANKARTDIIVDLGGG